ncbi:helix-turn-helix domain-containing protein [Catenulispora yoronensis]
MSIAAHPDPGQAPGDFDTLLGGLHTSPALIVHEGRQSGVQIMMSPLAARELLGMPAGAVAGIDVFADEALGRDVLEVRERLREAPDWPARFAAVDAWLMRRRAAVDARRPVSPEVTRAWRMLVASGGAVQVPALAAEVGWSTRHLAGRFGREIGLTPKAAARVVRFDRARRTLAARVREAGYLAPSRGWAWPTSRSSTATSTRRIWTGSSGRWPGARRSPGWPRSSETSKPSGTPAGEGGIRSRFRGGRSR